MSDRNPTLYRWVARLALVAGICYLGWGLSKWLGGNLAETERAIEARKHTWWVIVDPNEGPPRRGEIDVRNPRPRGLGKVSALLDSLFDANTAAPARVRVVLRAWQEDPNTIRYSSWGEGVEGLDVLCAPPAWSIQPVDANQLRVAVTTDANEPPVNYPINRPGRRALSARVYDTILESHRALAPYFRRNAPQVPNPKKREMKRLPKPVRP
jgi:hypothetical protein